ncbi:K homology domain-containing protein [Tanacetum coccineum]
MDCCSAQAYVLIGKAGDTIRTLQNSSGCHHCIEDDLLNANSATRTDYPFVQSVHAGLSPSLKELKGNSHFSIPLQ